MDMIAIGQPYDPSIKSYPEGCHYNFDASGHWLHYLYNKPSKIDVQSIQKGEAQFGLYVREPLIFLLHQFGDMAWNDASYNWWLVSEDSRKIPEECEGVHALLKVVMVDTETGLVAALRALTFSAEFTKRLHEVIRSQIEQPWSKDRHEQAVRYVYSRYSSMDLVERAEIFCKGGE
jgi:hypothetical protein